MVPSAPMAGEEKPSPRGEGPLLGAVGVDRVELVDHLTRRRWCRRRRWRARNYTATRGEGPLLGAVGVDGVELVVT